MHGPFMIRVLAACGVLAICAAARVDSDTADTRPPAETPAAVSTGRSEPSDPSSSTPSQTPVPVADSRADPLEESPDSAPRPDRGDVPRLAGLALHSDQLPRVIELSPDFRGEALEYSASVRYEIVQLTVLVASGDAVSSSFVEEDGVTSQPYAVSSAPGHQVALTVGENLVRVKATESESSQVYSITVVRAGPTVNVSAPKASVDEGASWSLPSSAVPRRRMRSR